MSARTKETVEHMQLILCFDSHCCAASECVRLVLKASVHEECFKE